jgi:hypothetical protein
VRVSAALGAAALALAAAALPAAGHAQVLWDHPAADRFRGTGEDAARLFAENGIPASVVAEQFRLFNEGRCRVREIGEGEPIDLMTFGSGHVLRRVIAAPALWPQGASRAAVECDMERAGRRYELLFPQACGNWSERIVPLGPSSPPFGPPYGPGPGGGPGWWGGVYGGNEEGEGFAGGFANFGGGGIGGLAGSPRSAPAVFTTRARERVATERIRLRKLLRRTLVERIRRVVYVTPPPSVPPIEVPPGGPPSPPSGSPGAPPPQPVPAPASGGLFATALAALAAIRRVLNGSRQ